MNNWGSSSSNYTTWNYKKVNKNSFSKYSAGILPYTFDIHGKCLFLLGKDSNGDWSDFGGRCEFKDRSDEKNTATREFYEETLGAVINIQECMNKITVNPNKVISKTLNGSPYYMYLVYIDHQNYSDTFLKFASFIRYQFDKSIQKVIEKVAIQWVSLDTLLNCIDTRNINPPISLRGVFYKTLLECREQLVYLTV
jgi:hypothetical protein